MATATRSRAASKSGRSTSRVEAGKKISSQELQAARSKGGKNSHSSGRSKK